MANDDYTRAYGRIYLVTNMVNGKQYVGQTTMDVSLRFSKHCLKSQYRSRLNYAIEKYGKENFTIETIDYALDQSELDALERLYIFGYQTMDSRNGYNVTKGGRGGIRTKEAAAKAAEKLRGRKVPRESVEKMAETKRGRPRTSAEQAVLDRMSANNKGRKHSEESKQLMSLAATGRKMPPATEEHRKKLSDAAKRQWALGNGHGKRRKPIEIQEPE